jgi:hypothetical protein
MLGSVVQVHLSPPHKQSRDKEGLLRCKPSLSLARYNHVSCYIAPIVQHEVAKRAAPSGMMPMQKLLYMFLASLLALLCATQACAARDFPPQARRGDMQAYRYPLMKIGDRVYRLAAGSHLYNEQNLIIMPASLSVQTAPVMYQLDTSGDLSRIWLLTREEAAQHGLIK